MCVRKRNMQMRKQPYTKELGLGRLQQQWCHCHCLLTTLLAEVRVGLAVVRSSCLPTIPVNGATRETERA